MLFWAGLVVVFAPVAFRLLSRDATRTERLGLVAVLGFALYVAKVLGSPTSFALHDELSTLRVLEDIAGSGHLFMTSPLVRIYPDYPGLEIVTTALASIGGTSLFVAGILLIGAARLMLAPALFLIFERAGRSSFLAGIATAVYMCNPSFLFFDAQFAYESLALPMAILLLAVALRREGTTGPARRRLTIVALILILGVVVTHHMTAFAMLAFLMGWVVVRGLLRWRGVTRPPAPTDLAAFTVVAIGAWTGLVASAIFGYILPVIAPAIAGAIQLLSGQSAVKIPFSSTGQSSEIWQQIVGYASVGLILVALPFGLWQVWRRHRTNPIAVLLGLTAMTYPVTLALRLTRAGAETSNRSSEFVFLGVAFVVAIALTRPLLHRGASLTGTGRLLPRVRSVVLVGAGVVMLFGGVIVGWPPYELQPGPYRVGADSRSIDATGIEAALWAGTHLPPSSRLLTDRANGLLMGSYGRRDPVTGAAGGYILANVFFSDTIGTPELTALQYDKIAYIVVDHRLATGVPLMGSYFEGDEPGAFQWRLPIALAALTKFDLERTMSRIYDNGTIVIYRYDPVAASATPVVTPARSPTP